MEYLLKSSAIILIFYLFYKIFFKNDTHFKTIRWFFLGGLLVSLTLPFIEFTKYVRIVPESGTEMLVINQSKNIQATQVIEGTSLDFNQVVFYIYLLGVVILLIQFLIQLGSLALLIAKHSITNENGYLLVETSKLISPFSFFNYIVYNPKQFKKEEIAQILTHEKVHAKHLHSFDMLLIQLFAIFQWFNPFIWFYRKELEQNLEFITDEITEQHVTCKKSYQQLLLKTSAPNYRFALANNFYNSLLKKRIYMLHKERSASNSKWKLALIAPILLAFLVVFNTKTVAQTSEDGQEVIEIKTEVIELVISKKATQKDLKKFKGKFAEQGLKVTFSGIKRNNDNEITAINIEAKTDNGKASASYAADDIKAIKPISISYDSENNNLSIGSTYNSRHAYHFTTSGDNNVFIKKGNKGTTEDIIHIETDSGHDEDTSVRVWKSKDGKRIKVGKTEDVIIDIDGDGNEIEKKVVKIYRSGSEDDDFFFMDDDEDDSNTKTTFIVNGKKITKGELKKMDKKDIKTIEIKKERKKKKN